MTITKDNIKVLTRSRNSRVWGDLTSVVHAGRATEYAERSLTLPTFNTATYVFKDTADLCDFKELEISAGGDFYDYGRYGNPSVVACERRLAALEQGEQALLFSSGMGAVSGVLLGLLRAGDHLVIGQDCYRKTRVLCNEILQGFGIEVSVVPMGDYGSLEAALRPNTKLIFFESPTNPYLRVVDLERLVELARRRDINTAIDSTFATPINQRPLEFGVDLVVHSATKYLSGNNDLLAGVVIGTSELVGWIRNYRGTVGGIPAADTAVQLEQRIKTLALRVRQQNESALKIADFLEKQPEIDQVWYPGLPSHPDYAIAAAQMQGFGGVVSFTVKGDLQSAADLIDSVRIPKIAASLGGVESLIEQPALISFYQLSTAQRLAIGIQDNLVRLSVGIEATDDLINDLGQALGSIKKGAVQRLRA